MPVRHVADASSYSSVHPHRANAVVDVRCASACVVMHARGGPAHQVSLLRGTSRRVDSRGAAE
eukprot:5047193-Lingulodinium_polyedra.AAC.1